MNDIEILEDYVELCKRTGMDKERALAIENLIQRNKELEEENAVQRHQLNSAFDRGFIHKDLVREKIQELKNKCNIIYGLEKCVYKGTIEILEELLNNKTS